MRTATSPDMKEDRGKCEVARSAIEVCLALGYQVTRMEQSLGYKQAGKGMLSMGSAGS